MRKKVLVKFRYMPSIFENNQVYSEVYAKKVYQNFRYMRSIFENNPVYSAVYAKKSVGIFTVYAKYI